MIFPGMYRAINTETFSTAESNIESQINTLGDLSQYDNCLAVPDGFDINSEFTMENLQAIINSEETPATIKRMCTYSENQPLIDFAEYSSSQFLKIFNRSRSPYSCAQNFHEMNFYAPDTFVGLEDLAHFKNAWIYNIVWASSDDFDVVFHEIDNNSIKTVTLNSGFNHYLYKLPSGGNTLYQGKKCASYAFEWRFVLGYDVCYYICQNIRGQRL